MKVYARGMTSRVAPASVIPTFRLGLVTLGTTLLLIAVGGFTRGSGSGYGCADGWPLCEKGLLGGWLPRADFHMIVEWSHRWLAAALGGLAIATAISAWRRHRDDAVVPALASAAVATILFQGWIGRAIVQTHLDADLVSLHLVISLTVATLLVATIVSVRFHRPSIYVAEGSWLALVLASAGFLLAVIMLGSLVHNLFFPGWPLMSGALVPEFHSQPAVFHFTHRLVSGIYPFAAIALWAASRKRRRPRHEVTMLGLAAILYMANVLVGAAHVFTRVSSAALVALHLGLASSVWVLTMATAASIVRIGRVEQPVSSGMKGRLRSRHSAETAEGSTASGSTTNTGSASDGQNRVRSTLR